MCSVSGGGQVMASPEEIAAAAGFAADKAQEMESEVDGSVAEVVTGGQLPFGY